VRQKLASAIAIATLTAAVALLLPAAGLAGTAPGGLIGTVTSGVAGVPSAVVGALSGAVSAVTGAVGKVLSATHHGASGNPFLGTSLYVAPNSDAAKQASAWAGTRPRAAAEMEKLAAEPVAEWYGGWLQDAGGLFRWRVKSAYAPTRTAAFIVVYNIPNRDCGSYSAGGAASPAAYRAWIDELAGAIGSYPTIAVIEPDALPEAGCAPGQEAERLSLIGYATKTLGSLPHTSAYIDAGRSDWLHAGETISLLQRAGIQYARGFALDTTGYASTGDELRYGDQIGRALGGKHFIVNTSRNGNGALNARLASSVQELWCNTPGRAIGPRPTTATGDPLADAFEWILHPGYSDGLCQGGPVAGTWWPPYALGLASRALY
jgi:endoglucanase